MNEWMRASEAIPANQRMVLVTVKSPHGGVVVEAKYTGEEWRDRYGGRIAEGVVVAWMDMPKAYGAF